MSDYWDSVEYRDKYKQSDRDDMAKSGEAMSDGSYPIKDKEDLANAIHAVGRGSADHDAIRKHIMARAKALGLSDMIPDNWNADGSLNDAKGHVVDLEQRMAMRDGVRNVRELRRCPVEFELRTVPNGTGGNDLLFTGFASVTNKPYEMEDLAGGFNEEVVSGAFRKTLDEGCDTTFLLNHSGMSLARTKSGTLKLSEQAVGSPTGLFAEARLDPSNPTVAALRSAVQRGDLDEMSFAFRVTRQRWDWASGDTDLDHRYIQEVNLNQGDVSLCNYGANPHTGGLVAVRAKGAVDWAEMFETFATAMEEHRAGKVLSAAKLGVLNQAMTHLGTSDTVAARAAIQSIIDSAASGASGNSETEAAELELERKQAEAAALLALARAREADKKRRKAA